MVVNKVFFMGFIFEISIFGKSKKYFFTNCFWQFKIANYDQPTLSQPNLNKRHHYKVLNRTCMKQASNKEMASDSMSAHRYICEQEAKKFTASSHYEEFGTT